MSKNHFSIEHNYNCLETDGLRYNDGEAVFDEFLDMTYDQMTTNKNLAEFVNAVVNAIESTEWEDNGEKSECSTITLIGEDGVFIWSIVMTFDEEDIRYSFVDWKKDEKVYKYESNTP